MHMVSDCKNFKRAGQLNATTRPTTKTGVVRFVEIGI